MKAKVVIIKTHFVGLPKESDFEVIEETLKPIENGEFLAEALFISVDPYLINPMHIKSLGTTFPGTQVAKITDSKNPKYPVGTHLVGHFGWRSHTVTNGEAKDGAYDFKLFKLPEFGSLPYSFALGVLGMPGNTAYFGFLEICQPKSGETVVVTGAAGAVGTIVGQIAKIKGCHVIGIAGSDAKGKWLVDEVNFDHFINYNDEKFEEKLAKAAPKGVDCFFDNVGGEITSLIMRKMNSFGRISVCGAISGYINEHVEKVTPLTMHVLRAQLKMEGFIVTRWNDRWFEGILQLKKWIEDGKLKYRETITKGIENTPKAFIEIFEGKNYGKAVVKI